MVVVVVETKRFNDSNPNVILMRQTCGQRSSKAAGGKRRIQHFTYFAPNLLYILILGSCANSHAKIKFECSAYASHSSARALAAGLPRQDHVWITINESFRLQIENLTKNIPNLVVTLWHAAARGFAAARRNSSHCRSDQRFWPPESMYNICIYRIYIEHMYIHIYICICLNIYVISLSQISIFFEILQVHKFSKSLCIKTTIIFCCIGITQSGLPNTTLTQQTTLTQTKTLT